MRIAVARRLLARGLGLLVGFAPPSFALAGPPDDTKSKAEEAIDLMLSLERPHKIGLAATYDGNKSFNVGGRPNAKSVVRPAAR